MPRPIIFRLVVGHRGPVGTPSFTVPSDQSPAMLDMVAPVAKQALVITQRSVTATGGATATINKQALAISQKVLAGVTTGVVAPLATQHLTMTQRGVTVGLGVVAAVGHQSFIITQQTVVPLALRPIEGGGPRVGIL